jgi:membrane protein
MIASMNVPSVPQQPLRERLAELLQTLRTWPWLDTLAVLRKRFREDHLGLSASSLTFTTTLALMPLATVTLALFTVFPIFGSFKTALEKYFIQALVPETIAKPVLGALTSFALKANRLGLLSLVAVVFTAVALMLTIDRTLNEIWRVRTPRPIAQRVLVYWAGLTLGPLVLGMSLSLPSYLLAASRGFVRQTDDGLSLFFDILQSVLLAGGMAALFRYVPNTPVRWRHAWAGAIFVAIGFELAKSGFAWYLRVAPFYSTIYGAFAAVPIFLLWIYLVWVIVLLGAVIAAYAPSLSMRIVHRPRTPGHRFEFALALLRLLQAAHAGPQRGLSITELAEALRCDPLQIEPVLEALVRLDWIARLDEGEDPRHVLLVDPGQTPAQPLLAALLLEPTAAVAPFWRRAGFERLSLKALIDEDAD